MVCEAIDRTGAGVLCGFVNGSQKRINRNSHYEYDNIIVYIMINREAELEWLTSHLSRDERQLLVLYGRRRVGKTTLVTTALENLEMTSVLLPL